MTRFVHPVYMSRRSFVISPDIETTTFKEKIRLRKSFDEIVAEHYDSCDALECRMREMREEMSSLFQQIQYLRCMRMSAGQSEEKKCCLDFQLGHLTELSQSLQQAYETLWIFKNQEEK